MYETIHLPKSSFMFSKNLRMMVIGSSGSGKSTFIKNFLRWKGLLCKQTYSHVIWASPNLGSTYIAEDAALMEEVKVLAEPAECIFIDHIPSVEEMVQYTDQSENRTLVVCDDFGEKVWYSSDLATATCRLSTHSRTDLILTNHSCFGKGPYFSTIWRNCNTLIIFRILSDASIATYLQRKLFPSKKNIIDLAFKKVHQYCGIYGFLVLQFSVDNPLNHRFLMSCNPFPIKESEHQWKHRPIYLDWKET